MHAFEIRGGGGSLEIFSRRRSVYRHATRVSEMSNNCLQMYAGSPSGITWFIGFSVAPGVTAARHQEEINGFPLDDQSRSRAAFGNGGVMI